MMLQFLLLVFLSTSLFLYQMKKEKKKAKRQRTIIKNDEFDNNDDNKDINWNRHWTSKKQSLPLFFSCFSSIIIIILYKYTLNFTFLVVIISNKLLHKWQFVGKIERNLVSFPVSVCVHKIK